MITDYANNPEDEPPVTIPDYVQEFFNAKLFLQKSSRKTGDNLYDHLSEVLNKILAERPENVIDFFEEYSRNVKDKRYKPLNDHLRDVYKEPERLAVANDMFKIFRVKEKEERSTVDPDDLQHAEMSNLFLLLFHLEQCGIHLPKLEVFYVMLSIKNLIEKEPLSNVRFWGKINGTFKNYIVLETELKEEEYIKRNEIYQQEKEAKEQSNEEVEDAALVELEESAVEKALKQISREQNFFGEDTKYPRLLPKLPKNLYEQPREAPIEPSGVGLNKKVYYVSNGIGSEWHQLPDVTPKQIRIARKIYAGFTGNLNEPMASYPEFPGLEKEYLRAQIARISAGTQLAPLGYYTFGKEDAVAGEGTEDEEFEEPEEAAPGAEVTKTSYRTNPKYEQPPLKDLLDASMTFWVHKSPYILPQGRTTWWNPNPMPDVQEEQLDEELGEEEEMEDEERSKDKKDGVKREKIEQETGPPLLTPLSEDAALEAVPPWSVRSTSSLIDKFSIAVVRSNLWPGAYCFSTQTKFFENIYVGYGLKYLAENFSPMPLPDVQQDYPTGPEIMEMLDPTGAEEEKWRIDHLPKPVVAAAEELEGEGTEEEEEEEEEVDEEEDED